jgi:potassium-dependent mechanosensitive channel
MHLLVIALFMLVFNQFCLGQAPVNEDEINTKIKSFAETETTLKEKWEELLKLRKSNNKILEEIKELTSSNSTLTSIENNFLKPTDFKQVVTEIYSPSLQQITKRVEEIRQLKEDTEAKEETLRSTLVTAEEKIKLLPDEIKKLQTDLSLLKTSPETIDEISKFIKMEKVHILDNSLKKLKLEQINLDLNIPILKSNLETIAKDNKEISEIYRTWNDKLIDANKDTAAGIKEYAVQLESKLSDDSPAKDITKYAIALSDTLLTSESINIALRETRGELNDLEKTLRHINEQQKYARERISLLENAGLSIDRETGTLLRKQRSELPTEKDLRLRLTNIFQESTQNELALLTERKHLESILLSASDAYETSLTESQRKELTKEEFSHLITTTRQIYNMVFSERSELSKEYRELVVLLQKTIESSINYSLFIDTRLLWIASHPPIGKQSFIEEVNSLKELYGLASLSELYSEWQSDMYDAPLTWIFFFLLFFGIIFFRNKISLLAEKANNEASRNNCISFSPTIIGLICVIILTLPVPSLLAFLSWRSPAGLPLHSGLFIGSLTFLVLGILSSMCKTDGFFVSNNMVKAKHLRLLKKVVKSLFIILPFIVITAESLTKINAEFTQGRLFNILSLIIMAAAMHYILLPKKLVLSGKKTPSFLSYLAYVTFVIFPIILVMVAASGYFISMLTLKTQLIHTIRVILIILFISALLKRWLLVSRRRVLLSTHQHTLTDPESSLTDEEKKQEIQETVSKVSVQSAKLIYVLATVILIFSLLTIWSKTLPALSVLDNVKLWENSSAQTSSPSGSSSSILPLGALGGSDSSSQPAQSNTTFISLQDLLITIIVSFLTYLAAVNIPALLQITIFNHLKLSHGTAYTVTTAIRYVFIIMGLIWAFGSIGVTWNKIQWLAAAITLGIGFGLQEIFANFVAGLILLFERPIRIGDMITVGEINGRVSKIQMRATTILQLNNRELIVPNKEFITGQLVNWTLSDNVIRVEIPVGIAYGSNTALAKSIMLQCALENQRTLTEPAPDVIFNAFGASSLDLILRSHISSVDDFTPVQSELHFAINDAFGAAGIEIAYPQQDIHIRTIDTTFTAMKSPLTTD